jgi:hypothetical protein
VWRPRQSLSRDAPALAEILFWAQLTQNPLCQNCATIYDFISFGLDFERKRFPDLLETLVFRRHGRSCWSRDVRPRLVRGSEPLIETNSPA